MRNKNILKGRIPISLSLDTSISTDPADGSYYRLRVFTLSLISFFIAALASFTAKFLVYLINLFTNLSFHGILSAANTSPAENSLGIFVIIVPVIGGIIVGLMAYYGSQAIRGHGIPEAMEQILVNQSRIKPSITYLKPLSSAVSIGTGGPFGAEGPIIATGGALGYTLGQLLNISNNERKILLAGGAAAGMSAIFGSPVAAIFLAIELLLFEFSPRSLIPVVIACITGGAGHYFLFGPGPMFPMPAVNPPGINALIGYGGLGIAIGVFAAGVTRSVYFLEDSFDKIPVHWMWWPAIGGVAVGIVGLINPHTLGVGYDNITDVLSGTMTLRIILSLCLLKLVSWSIALASGTSGGTLAPLFIIGGSAGAMLGLALQHLFPHAGIVLPIAALAGMSAMFAGASRALLTSILFAIETTSELNAILPLLLACTASYLVSFFLLENTIMTEKIARRGIKTPVSFEPDILNIITVRQAVDKSNFILNEENSLEEAREQINPSEYLKDNYFVVAGRDNQFRGVVSFSDLFDESQDEKTYLGDFIKFKPFSISGNLTLRKAVQLMARENTDVLAVVSDKRPGRVIGVLSRKDIIDALENSIGKNELRSKNISIRRQGLKLLIRGQKIMPAIKPKGK